MSILQQPAPIVHKYHAMLVCGDWLLDATKAYQAYTSGQRWNGWECPHFTYEVAKQLAQDMPGLQYDFDKGEFLSVDTEEPDSDRRETFPATVIDVEGIPTTVFAIGAWSWCWVPFTGAETAGH